MGLAVCRRRMRTSMTLAQLRQSGEGVSGRLAWGVIGTCTNTQESTGEPIYFLSSGKQGVC